MYNLLDKYSLNGATCAISRTCRYIRLAAYHKPELGVVSLAGLMKKPIQTHTQYR